MRSEAGQVRRLGNRVRRPPGLRRDDAGQHQGAPDAGDHAQLLAEPDPAQRRHESAESTFVSNRIFSSMPCLAAVSRTYFRIDGPSAIDFASRHGSNG